MSRAATIIGWGTALPDTILTNEELEERFATDDRWIIDRTGIRQRYVGGDTAELGATAAVGALTRAGLEPRQIDLLIMATSTPVDILPATSARIHRTLGLTCGAFDVNAACAGFGYALVMAYGALATGHRRILVVGADAMSKIVDPGDRSTAVLFGDGGGALVIEATGGPEPREGGPGLLACDLGLDSSGHDLLVCPQGGKMAMDGREVFRRAVRATVESAILTLERAKLTADDVSLFVPHQANIRILEAAATRLGIPMDRLAISLDKTGNTSTASIPLALAQAADDGRLSDGDLMLVSGFGAGMSWATSLIRWGSISP